MSRVFFLAGVVCALASCVESAGQITSYTDERGRRVYINAPPKPVVAPSAPTAQPAKRSVLVKRDPKTGRMVPIPASAGKREAPATPAAPPATSTRPAVATAAPAAGSATAPEAAAAATVPARASSLDTLIEETAREASVDANLVRAIIKAESNFNPFAISSKGARGLMQLMPQTANALGVRNVYDPGQNVAGGVRYLRQLLDNFGGQLFLSLAAYNAGPAAVERHGGIPPYRETWEYVNKVTALYRSGAISSPFEHANPARRGDRWGIVKHVDEKGRVHFSNAGW
jgi:soluble lytic murein transglycosylase-like protein